MKTFALVVALTTLACGGLAQADSYALATPQCLRLLQKNSVALEKQLKAIVDEAQNDYSYQMKQYGEATVGMELRDAANESQLIIDLIDGLKAGKNVNSPDYRAEFAQDLCDSNLDVSKTVGY